jgi:hypothetical protein
LILEILRPRRSHQQPDRRSGLPAPDSFFTSAFGLPKSFQEIDRHLAFIPTAPGRVHESIHAESDRQILAPIVALPSRVW